MPSVAPTVVVIDDSEAILSFARAVLSSTYTVATAKHGREGLEVCKRVKPQVVLLDLSMPEMDGEAVLAHMKGNADLEPIPVIIVSSEQARAEACLARGAFAYLVKPVRAEDMLGIVGRALEASRARAARSSFAVLPLRVGAVDVAVALADVRHVVLQPATRPLVGGPSYLTAFFELRGESVCVLDLAARFGVEHERPVVERKLVVIEHEGTKLALCVDQVRDPEEVGAADVKPIAPDEQGPDMVGALRAVVRTSHGAMPLVRPLALLSRGLVRSLGELVRDAGGA